MTREEFDTLRLQDPEGLFALIQQMLARLAALEEQVAKNSGNSSKPPSSDGLSKLPLKPMPQSLRKKTGKKPGGQKGQTGRTLLPVEEADQVVLYRPDSCPHCQTNLQDAPEVTYTRRQVFEMPQPKVIVTEHRRVSVACPCCGKESGGTFPTGVEHPVQYGPNLLGFATYLSSVHLLPFARCAKIIQDITGTPFGAGSLSHALETAFTRLAPFSEQLNAALQQTDHQHADETGCRVAGKLHWVHVRSTTTLCRLFVHEKRGSDAVGDLASYRGCLMSDFYSSYVRLSCAHQFCGAHLLRELTFVQEVLGQSWAGSLKEVIEQMVSACHDTREQGRIVVEQTGSLVGRFRFLVAEGLASNPLPELRRTGRGRPGKGKIRCLLERLRDYEDGYLAFLFDLSLPFTNNEAERDLRMVKVKGKISGCFRTVTGASVFCRLRSYVLTCQKQGMALLDCLRSVFIGSPLWPSLNPA